MNGYFWLPCPVCGEEFGGHEWLVEERWSNIPDPEHPDEPGRGIGICPDCTRAGVAKEAWKKYYLEHGLEDETEWEWYQSV